MIRVFLFFLGFAILFSVQTAHAQQPEAQTAPRKGTYKDGAAMLKGKMMHINKGVIQPLQTSLTMPNGTIVSPDGTISQPGKKAAKLKEGMAVNMQGRVVIFKDDMFTPEAITNNSEEVGYQQNTIILEQPDTVIIKKQ